MKVRTHIKADGITLNHNQTVVRDRVVATDRKPTQETRQGLKVKTHIKAGALMLQHNETVVHDRS